MKKRKSIGMNKKTILRIFLFSLVLFVVLQRDSEAGLCAFRNPDRDVYILFPEATGYRSIMKALDSEAQREIEEFLGQPLDYDEGGEHTLYLILKGEEIIGIIHPHAVRGRYGIVEMIWAITLDGKIIDFTIQRSRERGTKKLKSEEFHKQFRGKSLNDTFIISGTREINTGFISPVKEAIVASSIVAYGAQKILLLTKYLLPEYSEESEKDREEKVEKGNGK